MTTKAKALATALLLPLMVSGFAPAQQTSGTSAALRVDRVDPPNWWIGLPDPMLLISGEGLTDAKVTSAYPGVAVKRAEIGLGGKYLFVWLGIGASAQPGEVRLKITKKGSTAEAALPLARRSLAAKTIQQDGGFNGIAPGDVIYLIMPDRFADSDPSNDKGNDPASFDRALPRAYHGGDLKGIRQHLPYLKELGVTTLWLNPVYDNYDHSPNDYHGYGPVDLYAVDEHLGTLQDYKDLVQAAHAQGLKVLLDVVVNHVGPHHPWVTEPPNNRWFHGTPQKHLVAHSAFEWLTDPHASPRFWRDLEEGWFADVLPDLSTDDRWVAQYLRQNAMWWAETGKLDGFRLDTFPYVDRPFWRDFDQSLHKTYPRFSTVGEVFHADPSVTSFFIGGKTVEGIDTGVDTVFDFPLYFAIRDVVINGASAKKLVDVLRHDWMFPNPQSLVTFIGNHDVTRFISAKGSDKDKLKLAFSLLLTMRGIPQLYSGDEIGMAGGEDPDNRHDFPGGFPGDPQNAFTAAGRSSQQQEIFSHVQKLLQLRREHVALREGKQYHIEAGDDFYAFARVYLGVPSGLQGIKTERLLVVFNNAGSQKHFSLAVADTPLETAETATAILGSAPAKVANGHIEVDVPARSVVVYEVECGCDL